MWQLLAILLIGQVVSVPEPKLVSTYEANQHLAKRIEPAYPEMALAARIQGRVLLTVVIDPDGKVSNMKAVSGHPILVQAAQDAVKGWKFEPFKEGDKPVAVKATIELEFSPENESRGKYLQMQVSCSQQILHQAPKANETCTAALETALKLPQKNTQDRISAYRNAGFAAKLANKNDEATEDFKQQLLFARQSFEQAGNQTSTPFHVQLADAYKNIGDLHQADSEYTEAERARELTLHGQQTTPMDLQLIVREHAALLRQMDRNADAETLEKKWIPANQ